MCYYNSSCDPERIVLLGYRNEGNLAPLRPVEFICITMKVGYTYKMMCSGRIPIAVVNMIESIVCLPDLKNETEARRRATVISKHAVLCSNNTNGMYNVLCHAQNLVFFKQNKRLFLFGGAFLIFIKKTTGVINISNLFTIFTFV